MCYRLLTLHEMRAVTDLSHEQNCPSAISSYTLALQLLGPSMYIPCHDHILHETVSSPTVLTLNRYCRLYLEIYIPASLSDLAHWPEV